MKTGFNQHSLIPKITHGTAAIAALDATNAAFLARAEARFGDAAPELAAGKDLTI